jgi:iron complex transport system substrate-binding protein
MNVLRIGMLALALLAAAPARAQLVVHDDRGAAVTLAAPPQRIVSLLPSLTECVCALGACNRLVGTDRFSNEPAEVRRLPKLGGLEDALLERIVALRPDVVLAAPSARAIERLEALGLKVLVFESRDHADVRRTLEVLAQLLGEPARAVAVWAHIDAQTRDAVARVPAAWHGQRVYFEIDATPYAAGAGSFIGETLRRLGMANVVPPALGPFPKLNPEYVVRAQPDVVMAAARNLAEMPGRPGWSRLLALKRQRSCGFDPARFELLTRPGPRLGDAALLLADCLAGLPRDPAP